MWRRPSLPAAAERLALSSTRSELAPPDELLTWICDGHNGSVLLRAAGVRSRPLQAIHVSLRPIRRRDLPHDGLTLDDFCERCVRAHVTTCVSICIPTSMPICMPTCLDAYSRREDALKARLTRAEVAAIRLYTGPSFVAINGALRSRETQPWATTIACCYSGVLKLSMLSKPSRVYRGVREVERRLPDAFLDVSAGFAGGVELAFTSTTRSPEVALQYSGEGTGSILVRAEGLMEGEAWKCGSVQVWSVKCGSVKCEVRAEGLMEGEAWKCGSVEVWSVKREV